MKEKKIEEELRRLTNLGVITQVETSEWTSPTVSVKKSNGSLRLFGDYKVTYLNVNQYPLPQPEELFATLNNGQHFTKLDFSKVYLQVELDAESQKYLVINTLPKVVCCMDDILITTTTEEEYFRISELCLKASNRMVSESNN